MFMQKSIYLLSTIIFQTGGHDKENILAEREG